MTSSTPPSPPPVRPVRTHRRRVPRWRRASRATSVLLVLGATVWGVQLGVAAPNASPVDPPTVSTSSAAVVTDAADPATDPGADGPVRGAGRDADGPGRGGGRRG